MDPGIVGAIIAVVITSMLAPLVMGWVSGQAKKDAILQAAKDAKTERDQEAADRRAEKQQDWDRQDVVAARAEAANKHLTESQALLAAQADTAAALLAANTSTVTAQLKVIDDQGKINHTLVNSMMTRAMQNDLDGKRLLVLALRRIAGSEGATGDDADLMLVTEAKIAELERDLAERAEQQKIADAQIQKQSDDRAGA